MKGRANSKMSAGYCRDDNGHDYDDDDTIQGEPLHCECDGHHHLLPVEGRTCSSQIPTLTLP